MSFERGIVSFSVFYISKPLPENALQLFSAHAAPPIDTLGSGEISGWVSGRHLLDRVITEDNAYYAGCLRLALMKAERKIPLALLRVECKMEELAVMQAEGGDYLRLEKRMAIRKSVIDRLLPDMPPTLTGIPIVHDARNNLLFAEVTSEKQADALAINFKSTTGLSLIPMTAVTAAMKRKQIDAVMLESTSYSPELEDPLAENSIGQDFLTWLWFFSEARGGIMTVEEGRYGIMIEGPLTFFLAGDGAHVTVLRKGTPEVSAEAKTALLSGKKLLRAKLTIGGEHETWTTTFDAEDFIFRGFKTPKTEALDPISAFQGRMISLRRFMNILLAYYDRFLDERMDRNVWPEIQKDIHKWVSMRTEKR